LVKKTGQQVVLLGISLGATIALQAAAREIGHIKSLVAISIDTDTLMSDVATFAFLQEVSTKAAKRKTVRLIQKLGPPPYTNPAIFQLRARLLSDLGCIEHGRGFGELMRGFLSTLIRTYGWFGTVTALRNMNAIQRKLWPELVRLNLFGNWPQPGIPVHYIFGGNDPLNPASLVRKVSSVIKSADTIVTLPNAGHMAHFDEPATVRSVIVRAHSAP